MKRSISSRSSPISCCHSLRRSIQSSKVAMRAMGKHSVLLCDGFLTIRENTVILRPMDSHVKQVARPSSFIFTLFGDLVHRGSGQLAIGALIRLMGAFGLSEGAVRQAVSRMARQ